MPHGPAGRRRSGSVRTRLLIGIPLIVTVLGLMLADWYIERAGMVLAAGVPFFPFFGVLLMGAAVGTTVEVRKMLTRRGWATLPWHVFIGVILIMLGTVGGASLALSHVSLAGIASVLPGTDQTRDYLMVQAFYGGTIIFTFTFASVVWVWVSALWTGGNKRRDHEARAQAAIGSTFILTTIAVPFSLGFMLRAVPGYGMALVLLALLASRLGDVGAYFAGRTFGRHKLIVAVSPKKTIEGFIGGLAMSTLVAIVLGQVPGFGGLRGVLPGWWLPAAGVMIGASAQIGDLLASALKRWSGVKDSSNLIPEFGGVLDLCDGFLFSIPMLYAIVLLHGALGGLFTVGA
ncbi:MAG: phosphatidate cytidylyltransferase [Planctomycetota bacterium]